MIPDLNEFKRACNEMHNEITKVLTKFAAKGVNPRADENGIELAVGVGQYDGELMFRIVTDDRIDIVVEVRFKDALRGGRDYISSMEKQIRDAIAEKRAERRLKDSPILLTRH